MVVDEWIKKARRVRAMEYFSAIKEKVLPKTWMDLEVMVLREVSQAEKNKCCVTSHL